MTVGAASYATSAVYAKKFLSQYHSPVVSFWYLLIASILNCILAWGNDYSDPNSAGYHLDFFQHMTAVTWVSVIFLGVFSAGIGALLYFVVSIALQLILIYLFFMTLGILSPDSPATRLCESFLHCIPRSYSCSDRRGPLRERLDKAWSLASCCSDGDCRMCGDHRLLLPRSERKVGGREEKEGN